MRHLKEEFDKLTLKEIIIFLLAIGCQVAAIVAIFIGMLIEPRGEIHASVLTYFGITCSFSGALLGISAHYSNELTKFKTSVMNDIRTIQPLKKQESGIGN